ncbi:T-complex protein 1 subunit alpha (CCT1) [Vairimorpha necatrix]|uniref:T-complex protein 1 subunit alpha (CCT1) n=1 Tax=Vairimorpha necatrix TaxID=6039 RepID=A0AAX4JFP6_9MICR
MQNEISNTNIITGGKSWSGISAVEKNTKSILSVYNAIKSSFGPMGLDKMLVNAAGDVNITNDGATILQNMVIDDPAAKILVDLASTQDKEVGDGTTGVVLLACSLIEKGYKMIQNGMHPSVVVNGYRLAYREGIQHVKKLLTKDIKNVDDDLLKKIVSTTISSKLLKEENDLFCDVIIKAARSLSYTEINNKRQYNIKDVNILKHPGGEMKDSFFINGYGMNCYVASPDMKKILENVKILCLDISLQKYRLPLTASITVTDPVEMENIRMKEIEIAKSLIRNIKKTGATLVLTTKGIDDLCTKLLVEAGIVAIKRCKKEDLQIIAKYSGTQVYSEISDEETYTLGNGGSFKMIQIGNDECALIDGLTKNLGTIFLRGPNTQILDEMHRSVDDAMNIVKRTLESKCIVAGGGAVEIALSSILETFSMSINSREHIPIFFYSEAVLTLPKILCMNARLDPNELISKVIAHQKSNFSEYFSYGLDVVNNEIGDNFKKGIIEPMMNKMKALRTATEAAINILRINEVIEFPNK